MEYNFINIWFLIGLIGGGIPWSILFYGNARLRDIALVFQFACMLVGVANLSYGVYVVFFA